MNVGNILKVADAIEQASVPGLGFNMDKVLGEPHVDTPDQTGHSCGTIGCIAGWSFVLATGRMKEEGRDRPKSIAREWLGLSEDEAESLFYPNINMIDRLNIRYRNIPVAAAVRALRNLAITGKVGWEAAMKSDEPTMLALPVKTKRERV